MNKILIGLILACFSFDVNFNQFTIGLIPNFLGYYIVWRGLKEMENQDKWFKKIQPLTLFMIIFSLFKYIANFFNLLNNGTIFMFFGLVISLVDCLLNILVLYGVVKGVQGMETTLNKILNSYSLYMAWKVYAFLSPVALILIVIPNISLIAMSCGFISLISFFIFLNNSNTLYKDDKPSNSLRL